MDSLEVFAFQSDHIINFGDSVVEDLIRSMEREGFELQEDDIVVITSKVLSMQQKSARLIEEIHASEEAKKLAEEAKMDPRVVELVLEESDHQVYGAVFHAILAKTKYGLSANAGIDLSNSPKGYALLLPQKPDAEAAHIRRRLKEHYSVKASVIITDSKTIPLRRGTTAVAIGIAGMEPLIDERGNEDLYGQKMSITTRAIADNVATSANLLMGETKERKPFAVVRGVKYNSVDESSMEAALMPEDQCLYFAPLLKLIGEK